jgi:hypothetical protein
LKYATWKLVFDELGYGRGPEDAIREQGATAEGAYADGEVENGATILGYVYGELDESLLSAWQFDSRTKEEALAFCETFASKVTVDVDGKIIVEAQGE